MSFELWGIKITVSYPFLAVLTVFLFLDKTGLGGQMLCAAFMHELGHLAVMALFGQIPHGIDFVSFGVRIVKSQNVLSYGKEALIYAAGPLVNFCTAAVLCLGRGGFPALAQVHLLLGLFNLLPISILDGGQIVSRLAHWAVGPRAAQAVEMTLSILFLLPILAGALLLSVRGSGNITLIVTSFYLAAAVLLQRK